MTAFDRFNKLQQKEFIAPGMESLKNHVLPKAEILYVDDPTDYSFLLTREKKVKNKYVWLVNKNIDVYPSFPFYFEPTEGLALYKFPYVFEKSRKVKSYDQVVLVPTDAAENRYITKEQKYICGHYSPYKGQNKFNIFYVGKDYKQYENLKEKFDVQLVDTVEEAQECSFTDMLWIVYDDTLVRNTFKFSYTPDEWSYDFIHVFGNGDIDRLDGVVLLPKNIKLTQREIDHRFYANKKEIRIMASNPKPYEQYYFKTYQEYTQALENSLTDLFWYIPEDVILEEDFDFTMTFSKHNTYDREINHVFLNNKSYDGVMLLTKHSPITEKEFDHRFLANKKEWELVASQPKKYEVFTISTYEEYKQALETSTTELFWADSHNIDTSNFDFELYFTHQDTYNRKENHAFIHEVDGKQLYNGLFLCSKHKVLTEKEIEYRHLATRKEWNAIASIPVKYQVFQINNYGDYVYALENSKTEMFWGMPNDITIQPEFDFNLYFTHDNQYDRQINHVFLNGEHRDGIVLYSKHSPVTQKEIEHKFIANKKEYDVVASTPKSYDYYYINTYDEYLKAVENSFSELFFSIPNDITITDNSVFDFYLPHGNTDRKMNHVWLNGSNYDGISLMSKHSIITEKEFKFRFITNRIEHETVVSEPIVFDRFTIDSYADYEQAIKDSNTEMFWGIPSDIVTDFDFKFDTYIHSLEHLDRSISHLFLNGEHYDGIVLFSKSAKVSEKEVEHRFYSEKKEHDVVASHPVPYERYTINNYEDYTEALYHSETDLFWGIPTDVEVTKDFDFNLYFSHHNQFDRSINHIFLNNNEYDGVVLFSKQLLVSEKEIEHRFYIKKKEWDIVASNPRQYPIFTVNDYQDFLEAKEKSNSDMFWIVNDDILINDDFDWNFYISHHNQYERKINHVWKNNDYYDGVALISNLINISQREIDYRFFAIKKEYNETVSQPKPYDIVFISNGEPNADENYDLLCQNFPHAKRVQNVKGIHQAHKRAAELVETEMFWVVDGDAEVIDSFGFDHYVPKYDIDGKETVHVWRSMNPVNGLVYGYGGVKLLPTTLTRNVDVDSPDMTTSISDKFKGIDRMSNTTAFNTDAFSAWRSGFRECVKLSSRIIARQKDDETEFRLDAWCTRGDDKPYGKPAIAGAKAGRAFGEENKDNAEELKKINDFDWLKEQFKQSYQQGG